MKIHCKYDELVDVKDLIPYSKNRNQHPDEQIERLAKLIEYQGVRAPIIVGVLDNPITQEQVDPRIVKGHGTLSAIKLLKQRKAPVVFQTFENEDQRYAFVQSDNAIATWSELDLAGINQDIGELGPDFDIDLLGVKDFTIDAADKYGSEDEDDIPAIPTAAHCRMGDLFTLGSHRLLCGDSTDPAQVQRLMGGEKASVWLSDPPYGINHIEVSQEKGQSKGYKKIANDDLQDKEFEKFIFNAIEASLPHMKKGFAFYMWHAMKMQGYTAAAAAGVLFHRQIIWIKPSLVFGRGHYHWRHELCLMGWLQGNEPPFYGERNQTTVWQIGRENDKIHPTQKPIALLEPSILNHTKPEEIIYEPFSGSGSTLIACEKTGRRCFGLELDPLYCDVILDRWSKFTGHEPKREDGIPWSYIKDGGD